MTNEREGWGEDGSQLVIHNQLVTLELPDLPRFGVVSNESCIESGNEQVDKKNVGDEEENKHTEGGHP